MTRTKRIYNNPNLKKTKRIDLTKVTGKALRDMSEGEMATYFNDPLRNSISETGFLYHPYASGLCMGHCHSCRDPSKDQKHQRKIRKQEFKKMLDEELSGVELTEDALVELNSEADSETGNDL